MNTELLPWTAKCVDDMAFIRSMHTEAINHEPAICHMQTGNMVTGRPCIGSWVSYGLGSLNQNLPTFVVLVAEPTNKEQIQAISARLWSSGFLSGEHAGVSFRSQGDPILFINNPPGVPTELRRTAARRPEGAQRDQLQEGGRSGNAHAHSAVRDGVSHAGQRAGADGRQEASPKRPTSSTATRRRSPARLRSRALLARRLVERGVRFVQIYHNNWDHHSNVGGRLPMQCKDVDQATYGADPGSQGARHARQHAGHLGRRIRPHDLQPGRPLEGELRARSSSALLHHVDGGRRRQGRRGLRRRPTISATTSSRIRCTSAISTPRSCTCSASTTAASP